jgi:hypothetical protein
MKPLEDWSILWFVVMGIALLAVVLFGQLGVCAVAGCTIPDWLPNVERLVISIAVFALAIPALRKTMRKKKTKKAWWEDR